MKLLILGNFGKGALENYFVRGLSEQGIDVTQHDITTSYYESIGRSLITKVYNKLNASHFYKPINAELIQFLGNKMFDVILVVKGLTIFPATLSVLKKHTRLLSCYNPDHPFNFYSEGSGNRNILEAINYYDIYFSYAESITNELNNRFQCRAYNVPFGYDGWSVENSQIQSAGGKSRFADAWLFIGAYDPERANFLEKAGVGSLMIFGESKWASRNKFSNVGKVFYQNQALYGAEYYEAIRSARGIINLLRKQNLEEQSHNMRTFEVPGNGGLLIANRTTEQMNFFEDGKEAVYFDHPAEFAEKIRYLDSNPELIDGIKIAGKEKSLKSGYSYADRCKEMIRIFNAHLS